MAEDRLHERVQAALDGKEVWTVRAGRPLARLVSGTSDRHLGGPGSLPADHRHTKGLLPSWIEGCH